MALPPLRCAPNPSISWSSLETCFFHYFSTFTYKDLADVPTHQDFWLSYAMPLAHQNDALRRSIAAVGAAHQFFSTNSSLSPGGQQRVPDVSLHLYNRAITSIATDPSLDAETVLLCCLLFICYESMMGRYSESVKHLRAGLRLLENQEAQRNSSRSYTMQNIFDIYAHVGVEFSMFLEDHVAPTKDPLCWVALPEDQLLEVKPFKTLLEASICFKQLDLDFSNSITQCEVQEVEGNVPQPCSFSETCLQQYPTNAILDRIRRWSAQLELTVATLSLDALPQSDLKLLSRLRLQQSVYMVIFHLHWDENDHVAIDKACDNFLHYAELMAQNFIDSKRRTFSIDGELISGVSLIITIATDKRVQARAFDLLSSLNRREGIWDSQEIAEMHLATLAQECPNDWYETPFVGGIPGLVRALSTISNSITPTNGLLQVIE